MRAPRRFAFKDERIQFAHCPPMEDYVLGEDLQQESVNLRQQSARRVFPNQFEDFPRLGAQMRWCSEHRLEDMNVLQAAAARPNTLDHR
jgi:hypothetical protein